MYFSSPLINTNLSNILTKITHYLNKAQIKVFHFNGKYIKAVKKIINGVKHGKKRKK